ncbi:MAG: S41 family peptidase [Candidatus Sulfotelmatobacter sp.]|jgi:carboxyl-terminal processing protease
MRARRVSTSAKVLCVVLLLVAQGWPQQQISSLDRDRALDMLKVVADEVRKHYYDPKMHGIDWDAKVAEAKQKIEKTNSMNMALSEIAALLATLNDSHTFFLPPQHANRYDYGWEYQMVGEHCFVTEVRPKSDAEAKGVKPGDEIMTLDGYRPDRDNLWKMQYMFSVLRPQPGFRLGLREPAGSQRQVDVLARMREGKQVTDLTASAGNDIWNVIRQGENEERLLRARYAERGDQLIVLKVPEFAFSVTEVDNMIDKVRKYPALIVDLRGNPGGSVETLRNLVGGMFDKDVKIADRVGRKEGKPEVAKAGRHPFSGKLVVLVDSRSASAAEAFARVVQLEKRGTVVGDRTSGSVMEAKHYNEKLGVETVIFYGASVTESDLVMTDGKSLEHTGVTPDEIVLPSAADLAAGRDPVMARAAELLGVKVTPEEGGKMFPYEWPPE